MTTECIWAAVVIARRAGTARAGAWDHKPVGAASRRALFAVCIGSIVIARRAGTAGAGPYDTAPFADERQAQIAVECLLGQRTRSRCQLEVYCVMPDHVHLIVTPMVDGASSLSYVDRFKGWSSYMMRSAGYRGRVWQARSYDHVVRRDEDLLEVAAYILANPVRRGLCADFEEYPWSGIPEPLATLELP
jgi:putative transposase